MRTLISISLIVFICQACMRHGAIPDIIAYVEGEDKGLKRILPVGKWEYTIQYRPTEYILIQEGFGTDTAGRATREEQLEGIAWFNISFRVPGYNQSPLRYGLSSMVEYNERLQYFLSQAGHDIYMLYGADTIHPSAYGFDNNHNLTPHETIVVGFMLPAGEIAPTRNMGIVLYDRVFGNGIIKATIQKKHLDYINSFSLCKAVKK